MIYTSYFAFIPKLPGNMLKISVSLYTPQWARIDGCFPYLNPTEQLLREAKSGAVSPEKAMGKYCSEILGKLSPTKVYEELIEMQKGSNREHLALLCYEKPGEICHRRFIARWLEEGNGISVPEYVAENDQMQLI
ncbi:MAG: DUF488 domain-containing protein [Holosporaceae bacterium]|jgi:uncharacterized protein YeaO (DUF488 family)|nr:DUF488 domain-containing protein [Holosporaceae bacterium]